MAFFKSVFLLKDGKKKIILKNLNLDNLKRIMEQNEYNTLILDHTAGRFLFYDYTKNISNKYNLYDLDILFKSDETFEMVMLLKCNENDIQNKIDIAEMYRTNCLLSLLNNENEQDQQEQQKVSMQQKDVSDFSHTAISNISSFDIDEQQHKKYEINYDKTILQCDDDDSDRPTFDDIVTLEDVANSFTNELEDDENNANEQEITCDIKNENRIDQSDNTNDANSIINKSASENINTDLLSSSEKYIISTLMNLSNRFNSFATDVNERLNIMERNFNERLNILEKNVNKRLSNMENNINLIYERQSLQSLLTLLDSVYLISSDRLETRTFYADESYLTLKFFRFVSKQLIKVYTDRWSSYTDIVKQLSLKPKCIEINLLGFGRLEKPMYRNKKIYSIQSPTLLCVDSTTNYRSSYVSQCRSNFDKPLTHVLVFEGTTSPVYFETELLKQLNSSSLTSLNKNILSMKSLLRKLLQLERIVFFLSFYYKIDLSQFFAGLVCFHFYHNSHIDTTLLLKNIMASDFTEAIPLLNRLYAMDQFILTY